VHYFTAPEPGKFYAKLNWRVSRPNGQFYERSDVQTFEQDPNAPGILYNHDNEFLHYQDDWYIAAFDPNDYMFVYYRGSNDAWDGYGGAVIYSRTPELNPASIPVLRETAERARPLCVKTLPPSLFMKTLHVFTPLFYPRAPCGSARLAWLRGQTYRWRRFIIALV